MSLRVEVLVPHRDREKSLERHLQQWDELGWKTHVADCDEEVFTRARAINKAAERATKADVLIITDVDMVLADPYRALEAAEIAHANYCYVCTFTEMWPITQEGTRRLQHGQRPLKRHIQEKVALIWGAPAAVPRRLFDRVGGMDPRFYGYGHEDLAFLYVTDAYGSGKQRVPGIAYHQWHDENTYKHWNIQNATLASRYKDALGNKRKLRAIIRERQ